MTIRKGRGVSAVNYPTGMNLGGDPTQALVHSTPTGNFMVSLSSVDLGQGMKQIMSQICAETIGVPVDRVIVDTPPARDSADARVIAATCGQAVLVGRNGRTDARAMNLLVERLRRTRADLAGVVLNAY